MWEQKKVRSRLLRLLFVSSLLAALALSAVAPAVGYAGAMSNASGFYDDTWK
jgi:hypothetical protein